MTSKALFSKLLKDEMKRRIWVAVAFLLGALLLGPVVILMQYEYYETYILIPQDLMQAMIDSLRPSMGDMLLTTGIAVVLALTGYAYLFSKKKIDLYHSIPVKREKLFFVSYMVGIIIYLSVYLIQIVTVVIVAVGKGFLTNEAILVYLHTIVGNIIHFLLIYHMTIIAVMLTGNLLVSMAATGVFLFYGLIASEIIYWYSTTYFSTYSVYPYSEGALWRSVPFISPIASYAFFVNSCSRYTDVTAGQQSGHLIVILLISAALFAVALWMYKKRPSEAAGKAITFRKTEAVIRIFIVILVAMGGSLMFDRSRANPNSNWFWFGLILAGVVCHCLMEIIYRFDFKAFFNHKLQLGVSLLVTALIGIIYRQDLLGYDTYLPRENQIKSASVVFTNIDNDMSSFLVEKIENGVVIGRYTDRYGKQLKQVSFSNVNAIYELGKLGVEQLDVLKRQSFKEVVPYKNIAKAQQDGADISLENEDNAIPLTYQIRYTLNSGRTLYRSYAVKVDSAKSALASIYDSKEYKEASYGILSMIEQDAFKRVEVYDVWGNKQLSLNGTDMQSFLKIYEKDLMRLSVKTLETEMPIARLNPVYQVPDYEDSLYGYYIYPSFADTIGAMKKMGVSVKDMTSAVSPDDIESIRVTDSGYLVDTLGMKNKYSEGRLYVNSNPEARVMIEQLCKNLVNANFSWSNITLYPLEQRIGFEVLYKTKDGIQRTAYAYMKAEQIPQQVIDELVETAKSYD